MELQIQLKLQTVSVNDTIINIRIEKNNKENWPDILTITAWMMSSSYLSKCGASSQTTLQTLVVQRFSRSMGCIGGHFGIAIRSMRMKLATVIVANILCTTRRNQPRLHDVFLKAKSLLLL